MSAKDSNRLNRKSAEASTTDDKKSSITIIAAIIGAAAIILGAILTPVVTNWINKNNASATQTAAAQLSQRTQVALQTTSSSTPSIGPIVTKTSLPNTPAAAITFSPSPPLTIRSTQPDTMPQLPLGYAAYGAFSMDRPWPNDWWLDDSRKLCTLTNEANFLSFACKNNTITDTLATLHPSYDFTNISGIAIVAKMQLDQGDLEFVLRGECPDQSQQQDYHLSLHKGYSKASVYYPPEYNEDVLGQVTVAPDMFHVLQIERSNDEIIFSVDNKAVPLTKPFIIPACITTNEFFIDLYIWKDGQQISGQIYLLGTR